MLDDMFLMLFNLMFSSLSPLAIGNQKITLKFIIKYLSFYVTINKYLSSGVYDQDAPEEILLAQPHLYRQGRLGRVYKPHSFWVTIADCLYQSIVVFFVAKGVSKCST